MKTTAKSSVNWFQQETAFVYSVSVFDKRADSQKLLDYQVLE